MGGEEERGVKKKARQAQVEAGFGKRKRRDRRETTHTKTLHERKSNGKERERGSRNAFRFNDEDHKALRKERLLGRAVCGPRLQLGCLNTKQGPRRGNTDKMREEKRALLYHREGMTHTKKESQREEKRKTATTTNNNGGTDSNNSSTRAHSYIHTYTKG